MKIPKGAKICLAVALIGNLSLPCLPCLMALSFYLVGVWEEMASIERKGQSKTLSLLGLKDALPS